MSLMNIVDILDTILFTLLFLSVLYLFVFAFAALFRRNSEYPQSPKNHRFVVLFPAYKEDRVIENSVTTFLQQEYPRELFDVVVISDHMHQMTNQRLKELPIKVYEAAYEESSKAKALNLAVERLHAEGEQYDILIILDADNGVSPNFLTSINDAYYAGVQAMQCHRIAKNRDTDMAVLDGMSEEVNNSIFRKGHVRLGLSSALIGSGMAFDYKWFTRNVVHLTSAGEDRELEVLLLSQGVYVDYLEHVEVYDEKIQGSASFYKQRRRWLAAQYSILITSLRDLPRALLSGNWDYSDKLIQWMMFPRIVLIGLVGMGSVAMTFFNWKWSVKWWAMLFLVLLAMALAIPDYIMDKRLRRTLKRIPFIFFLMVANMFRLRGVNKRFIHTQHGEE